MRFSDRGDAGRRLAVRLQPVCGEDLVVLGLPRGGVPVAYEVARTLGAPLDVIMVRKLGIPYQPELAFEAIGEDRVRVLEVSVLNRAGLSTLPFDLLTVDEEINRAWVFDIALLARRLVDVTGWLTRPEDVTGLRIGCFKRVRWRRSRPWPATGS